MDHRRNRVCRFGPRWSCTVIRRVLEPGPGWRPRPVLPLTAARHTGSASQVQCRCKTRLLENANLPRHSNALLQARVRRAVSSEGAATRVALRFDPYGRVLARSCSKKRGGLGRDRGGLGRDHGFSPRPKLWYPATRAQRPQRRLQLSPLRRDVVCRGCRRVAASRLPIETRRAISTRCRISEAA